MTGTERLFYAFITKRMVYLQAFIAHLVMPILMASNLGKNEMRFVFFVRSFNIQFDSLYLMRRNVRFIVITATGRTVCFHFQCNCCCNSNCRWLCFLLCDECKPAFWLCLLSIYVMGFSLAYSVLAVIKFYIVWEYMYYRTLIICWLFNLNFNRLALTPYGSFWCIRTKASISFDYNNGELLISLEEASECDGALKFQMIKQNFSVKYLN